MNAMLSQSQVTTFLPVDDVQRARSFYEGKLGFPPAETHPDGHCLYRTGSGALIALRPLPGAAHAEHTALSFEVKDIEDEVRELEARGVVFEDYDLPDLKTVNHVCALGAEKAAWFRDTEGNYLCLHQAAD